QIVSLHLNTVVIVCVSRTASLPVGVTLVRMVHPCQPVVQKLGSNPNIVHLLLAFKKVVCQKVLLFLGPNNRQRGTVLEMSTDFLCIGVISQRVIDDLEAFLIFEGNPIATWWRFDGIGEV